LPDLVNQANQRSISIYGVEQYFGKATKSNRPRNNSTKDAKIAAVNQVLSINELPAANKPPARWQ
jgi:hypothetical protein